MAHIETKYYTEKKEKVRAYKAVIEANIPGRKRKTKTYSVEKYGKKEAKKKAKIWMADKIIKKEKGMLSNAENTLFADFVDYWIDDYKKPNIQATTHHRYKNKLDAHIKPYFRSMKIKDIKPYHIEKYLADKRENGHKKKEDTGLSENTLHKHYVLLKGIFKRAIKLELIHLSPMRAIDPPSPEKKKIKVMSKEELQKFFNVLKDDLLMFTFVFTTVMTGLRKSEILGLEWEDVDLDNRILNIRQALVRVDKKLLHKQKMKTESSRRKMKISKKLAEILRTYHLERNKERLKTGVKKEALFEGKKKDFVFCRLNGQIYRPEHYNEKYNQYLEQAGLPSEYNIHTLRHTFGTMQQKNKVDLDIIKEMMGHSTIATTADFYLHPDVEEQEEAMSKMDNAINFD